MMLFVSLLLLSCGCLVLWNPVEAAELVHINQVPCLGNGRTPFEKDCIVPDLVDVAPSEAILVTYPDGSKVNFGNELDPKTVNASVSSISWNADVSSLYTLSKSDPDASSRQNASRAPIDHWLVVNIPGSDVSKGDVIMQYGGARPPQGSGFHRYVFMAFKQKERIDTTSPDIAVIKASRMKFEIRDFASKNNLGYPVAGNYYVSQYSQFLATNSSSKLVNH